MASIYMPLLNEGTETWRPVRVSRLSGDVYRIDEEAADEEQWAFPTGAVVVCEWKTFSDGSRGLAATRHAS